MSVVATLAGLILVLVVLWDVFETIVLPRRVSRRVRLTRLFYLGAWLVWATLARRLHGGRRESYLSFFGPLSLLLLLLTWALVLILGFALIHSGLGTALAGPPGTGGFEGYLYFSGTTFFTLGLGDVTPLGTTGRIVTVAEAGTGFALLGLVIGYLPTFYQAFSRREVSIALLDARAGSPPTGFELLARHSRAGDLDGIARLLREWEVWAAELLESHLSHPQLGFFRSQHDNTSWLAALTAVLDACALVLSGVDGAPVRPAQLTFAMARHAVVDLCQVLDQRPRECDRLTPAVLGQLDAALSAAGVPMRADSAGLQKLAELRREYEPYVCALSSWLLMALPPWIPAPDAQDDWIATAWRGQKGVGKP
jgi:hypothetical protein